MDDQDHYSVDDSGATAIADDIAERIGVDKATAILLHETLIEQTWRADDEGCEPDGGLPPASIGAMKGRLARVAEYSDDELDACADEALVALKGAGWSCRRCGGPWPPGSLCEQCDYQNRLLEDLVLEPMVEQGILEHDGVDDEGRIVYKSLVYEGQRRRRRRSMKSPRAGHRRPGAMGNRLHRKVITVTESTDRITELEERAELLERVVRKRLANVSAAGVLLGGVRRDEEETR